jgi:serine/threonine protein kinase
MEKPMSAESDLLRVVLALQMGFVTKEQVVECGAVWADDRTRGLTDLLSEKGYLKDQGRIALDAMVKARVEAYSGDPGQSLVELSMYEDFHRSILALPLDENIRATLMEFTPRTRPPEATETIVVTKPREEERYRLGAELGRGGLGRVVAAEDTVLGREVAIKEMLGEAAGVQALKRFLREGEVAGRLLHPNIVPVFDVGVREDGDRKTPYFAMGKIAGRDLKEIIEAVERGSFDSVKCKVSSVERGPGFDLDTEHSTLDPGDNPRRQFSRPRLLRIFQDVCLAIAYAHHHGVIHRDLKPANVMVGGFGEVYVVDWGLAKVVGEKYDPGVTVAEGHAEPAGPALTMHGQTLGTPAYMPPEQADGCIDEIDHQSDIYSLGAILYEILTFRPPFEGTTVYNVIAKVLKGNLIRPSKRASEMRLAVLKTRKTDAGAGLALPGTGAQPPGPLPESVPPELDEIAMKALSKDKAQRYASVLELNEEVQKFLEGEKERERKRLEAVRKIKEGRNHLLRFREMGGEVEREEKALKEGTEEIKSWMPVEEKQPLWEKQTRLRAMREQRMEEFGNAETAFSQAMASDPSNHAGREGRCELYLDRYFAAEKRRDPEEMALYRNLLSKYDKEGKWLGEIDKPGTLSLRVFSYACECLKPVRNPEWRVEFGEEPIWPWRDGRALPDCEVKDDDRPVPEIKVSPAGAGCGHTDACERREVEGAEVWIGRYEEKNKRLVLDGERLLGTMPIEKVELEQGSYLCLLRHPGFAEVRLPVRIDRGGVWEQNVNLYRKDEIPKGFCWGREGGGGGRENTEHGRLFHCQAPGNVRGIHRVP